MSACSVGCVTTASLGIAVSALASVSATAASTSPLIRHTCAPSCLIVEKSPSHRGHLWHFSFECISICLFRCPFLTYHAAQRWQGCNFFALCPFRCRCSVLPHLKVLSHSGQWCISFPLTCRRSCLSKYNFWVNLEGHIRHAYGIIPVCARSCPTRYTL